MSEPQKILWSDCYNRSFSRRIEVSMLVSDVEYLEKQSHKNSQSPKLTRHLMTVIYNRDYVVNWIAKKLLKPLAGVPYNDIQKLISEARKIND